MTESCQTCEVRPAKFPVTHLCGACYMAVYRRLKRGEPWVEALADRRRQVDRLRKGLSCGMRRSPAN